MCGVLLSIPGAFSVANKGCFCSRSGGFFASRSSLLHAIMSHGVRNVVVTGFATGPLTKRNRVTKLLYYSL